ncbi:Translocon-associated protein, alpha subunit, putative [Penicillium digitatum]|uniref:Translocon-associated protein, alpha subunit, putative n=3 Tax=Penicillium digitatum TaxID=36651 RepID=K9FEP4_PEND2|nr:Translocon-associated protein, alpha subunit, putative [Penicillium digitatum Pd1]EKV06209.1 Translocon-associated protein, alpha subunit, putative [Penicillium digitatum Pd1]EKV07689.1 Translocon-associated protein, alpha subunit, putative [Penicillium digitatum PHI26]QQK40569.1 Translocon-associated protein, alpha subunit, putative [Penicillium digitatum]
MTRFGLLSVALLSLQAFIGTGIAADTEKTEAEVPTLAISAQASFPASEIFGIKLVNGHPTQALIAISNDEPNPITVNFIGGSLRKPDDQAQIVRNLTATRYAIEVPAGEKETISYSFTTEMHPQDLQMILSAIVTDSEGHLIPILAHNGTVSIVEADTSIFDPQIIFLYFFLLACVSGTGYFFYTVWVAPYFPQKRKSGKISEKRAQTSSKRAESPVTEEPSAGAAVSSASAYNADWIPSHHINRPEARKVKGRSKARA